MKYTTVNAGKLQKLYSVLKKNKYIFSKAIHEVSARYTISKICKCFIICAVIITPVGSVFCSIIDAPPVEFVFYNMCKNNTPSMIHILFCNTCRNIIYMVIKPPCVFCFAIHCTDNTIKKIIFCNLTFTVIKISAEYYCPLMHTL